MAMTRSDWREQTERNKATERSRVGVGLLRRFCRLVLVTWPERRRQRKHLAALDADGLRDIGKTRSQARREARRWFWE